VSILCAVHVSRSPHFSDPRPQRSDYYHALPLRVFGLMPEHAAGGAGDQARLLISPPGTVVIGTGKGQEVRFSISFSYPFNTNETRYTL
jgi:hypothetical protein